MSYKSVRRWSKVGICDLTSFTRLRSEKHENIGDSNSTYCLISTYQYRKRPCLHVRPFRAKLCPKGPLIAYDHKLCTLLPDFVQATHKLRTTDYRLLWTSATVSNARAQSWCWKLLGKSAIRSLIRKNIHYFAVQIFTIFFSDSILRSKISKTWKWTFISIYPRHFFEPDVVTNAQTNFAAFYVKCCQGIASTEYWTLFEGDFSFDVDVE